jgi:quinohemoprotein ethanol dehydrogenase
MNLSKGRLLVFKLGGAARLPPLADASPLESPPRVRVSLQVLADGERLYATHCEMCHGSRAAGGLKDLRRMTNQTRSLFQDIVRGGIRKDQGMASFSDLLTKEEVDKILQYVTNRAYEDWGNF